MNPLCIIQARAGSSRFPGKAFASLGTKAVIRHVVDRATEIGGVGRIIVAVPDQLTLFWSHVAPSSSVFMPRALVTVERTRAPEDDVLGRYAGLSLRYPGFSTIMRLTGDCPLLNPRIAEQVLGLYRNTDGCEYASNIAPGYVDGEDVEVFSREALEWANREASDPFDREHVTPWIRRHCKTATLLPTEDRSWLKTSIDTPEDLERVRALMAQANV